MAKNLEDERIRAEIQRAISITKDVEEPFRLKAFEIVLSRSLNDFIVTEKSVNQKKIRYLHTIGSNNNRSYY